MKELLYILGFLVFLAALNYAANQDIKQAKMEAEHYCEMVSLGAWPNYENRQCDAVRWPSNKIQGLNATGERSTFEF